MDKDKKNTVVGVGVAPAISALRFPEEQPATRLRPSPATVNETISHNDEKSNSPDREEKYNLKSEQEIRELLETSLENLDFDLKEPSKSTVISMFKSEGFETLGDILVKTPEELLNEHKVFSEQTIMSIVNAVKETGIEYGEKFAERIYQNNKEKYLELYEKTVADGYISPSERILLESLRKELGFSEKEVNAFEKNYRTQNDIEKPSEAEKMLPVALYAHELCEHFTDKQFFYAKEMSELNKKNHIPAFPEITDSHFSSILNVFDAAEYNLWVDFDNNRFYLEDRQGSENKFEEVSFPGIISKAGEILNEWSNDEMHSEEAGKWEKEAKKLLEDFYPSEYLLPVEVNYQFELPNEILMKDGGYDNIGRRPVDICDQAICGVFKSPSEIVKNSYKIRENGTFEDLTYRHYIAVSADTDYKNISYKEISDVLQKLVGEAINEALGTEESKQILFESVNSSRPVTVNFYMDKKPCEVWVTDKAINKYKLSPEEYSLSLDLNDLASSKSRVRDAVRDYIQDRELFMAALEEIPELKEYVLKQWDNAKTERSLEKEHVNKRPDVIICNEDLSRLPEYTSMDQQVTQFWNERIEPELKKINPDNDTYSNGFTLLLDKVFELPEYSAGEKKTKIALCKYTEGIGKDSKVSYIPLIMSLDEENRADGYRVLSPMSSRKIAVEAVCKEYCGEQWINNVSIMTKNGLNVTDHLLENDGKERENTEKKVLGAFFNKLKEACGSDKSLENILKAASSLMFNLNPVEKEILGKAFEKKGLVSQSLFTKYLEKEVNPPEYKRERLRPDYERGR